jgi:hypothetical protein
MKKAKYPIVQPDTPEYQKYRALLRITVIGLAKKDQILEKEDLRGYLAEIRRKVPNLIGALNLDENGEDELLNEVQKELQEYYVCH